MLLVDATGIGGPQPRKGMRVAMSEAGRVVCKAHGFYCPASADGQGSITKLIGGGQSVKVQWEEGKEGDYLCGKFDQHMLVCVEHLNPSGADSHDPRQRVHGIGAVVHHPGWGDRAWWKGNTKVRVHDHPALGGGRAGGSVYGRLLRPPCGLSAK